MTEAVQQLTSHNSSQMDIPNISSLILVAGLSPCYFFSTPPHQKKNQNQNHFS